MEIKYCERVGEQALFSLEKHLTGEIVFQLDGEIKNTPTKYTIEISKTEHIIDKWGIYMNHSFDPSTKIIGRNVVARYDINIGDEINFNYNASETNMATPFDTPYGYVGGKKSIKG